MRVEDLWSDVNQSLNVSFVLAISVRLLLRILRQQQSSFVLKRSESTLQATDEAIQRLSPKETTLQSLTEVMSEDLIPEKMREDYQDGESLSSVCVQSFRERWWNKVLLAGVLETDGRQHKMQTDTKSWCSSDACLQRGWQTGRDWRTRCRWSSHCIDPIKETGWTERQIQLLKHLLISQQDPIHVEILTNTGQMLTFNAVSLKNTMTKHTIQKYKSHSLKGNFLMFASPPKWSRGRTAQWT